MIDRDLELELIEEFIRREGVTQIQTAFVVRTLQVDIPDREFIHSNVKRKIDFTRGNKLGKYGKYKNVGGKITKRE